MLSRLIFLIKNFLVSSVFAESYSSSMSTAGIVQPTIDPLDYLGLLILAVVLPLTLLIILILFVLKRIKKNKKKK